MIEAQHPAGRKPTLGEFFQRYHEFMSAFAHDLNTGPPAPGELSGRSDEELELVFCNEHRFDIPVRAVAATVYMRRIQPHLHGLSLIVVRRILEELEGEDRGRQREALDWMRYALPRLRESWEEKGQPLSIPL